MTYTVSFMFADKMPAIKAATEEAIINRLVNNTSDSVTVSFFLIVVTLSISFSTDCKHNYDCVTEKKTVSKELFRKRENAPDFLTEWKVIYASASSHFDLLLILKFSTFHRTVHISLPAPIEYL